MIAEALRTRGVEVYGLVTPERPDPPPPNGPKPDPHAMSAKFVRMCAKDKT